MISGVAAVSLAAIFIRLAQADGVPSLFIAAARLTIAAAILTPLALRKHMPDFRELNRRDGILILISGFFLAVHFATWILSLEYTSVLIGVALVTTSPLWTAILESVFLRTRLGQLVLIGLLMSVLGSIIATLASSGNGFGAGEKPVLGSLLALTGAVCVAIYLVIGRNLRARLNLLPYIWLVYSCAAIILLIVVIVGHVPTTGFPAQSYVWLVAVALLPQLVGHSSFNYALKYVSATFVGITTQLEPILSALVAIPVFGEIPGLLQIIGSATILVGVALASIGQNRNK